MVTLQINYCLCSLSSIVHIYIYVYVKESVVFLLVGLSGITRNSSPVCVSIIEAVMTDRNWREDPGYPV